MQRLTFEKWIIEVDPIKTYWFYEQQFSAKESCNCLYCRNYYEACKLFSKEVKDFFNSMGLEPCKAAEVYEMGRNEDGTYLYGGFYHVVGNLVSVNNVGQDSRKGTLNLETLKEDFKFGFTTHLVLVPEEFPQPVLQLEINTNIPWVLNEKSEES